MDFERALAWHRIYGYSVDEIYIYLRQIEVEATDDGYLVQIEEVAVNYYEGMDVGSDAWSAFYLINESTVLRGEGRARAQADTPAPNEWAAVCR